MGLSPRVVRVRMRVWQVEMGGDVRVVCGGHARVRFHVFGWLFVCELVARWCVCCRVPLINEWRLAAPKTAPPGPDAASATAAR